MTQFHDLQYVKLVREVLTYGVDKSDRTGTGTKSVFGRQVRFDLSDESIPLLTTKKMHIKSIIHELLWYLMGTDKTQYLDDNGITIWKEWTKNGSIGRCYGVQWRIWQSYKFFAESEGTESFLLEAPIDQIANVIEQLKTNPDSRRMIVSAWNVAELDQMSLSPCHAFFQFYAVNNKLSCMMTQRSADIFLGVPFNIAQYSILTRMIAHVVGMDVGELIVSFGDLHAYNNHNTQLIEQIGRRPYQSPTLTFAKKIDDIDSFEFEDFIINNYVYHPTIKGEVSV